MNSNIRNSFFISALLIIALTLVGCSGSSNNSDSGSRRYDLEDCGWVHDQGKRDPERCALR